MYTCTTHTYHYSMPKYIIYKWSNAICQLFTRYTDTPKAVHNNISKHIFKKKIINHNVKKAGRPLFSPMIHARSAKTRKKIQRSKPGAKNINSAITKGNGKTTMWNKMSNRAQINTPSFRSLPQQHVLQTQQKQHIFVIWNWKKKWFYNSDQKTRFFGQTDRPRSIVLYVNIWWK